jgi:hypothetical protein
VEKTELTASCPGKKFIKRSRLHYFFLVLLLAGFLQSSIYAQTKFAGILPAPRELSFTGENFKLGGAVISVECAYNDPALNNAVGKLKTLLVSVKASLAEKDDKAAKKITLSLSGGELKNAKGKKNGLQASEARLGEEGYLLSISAEKVSISANTVSGLFYGVASLMQIVRNSEGFLPGLRITDFPMIPERVVMDDISRGPVPTMAFMKRQIDRLSEMKINGLMYYVEHVFKTKSHPEFAPDEGSLSVEEFAELAEYAKLNNVKLIASFQSFGHFENILKTPKYAHLGESGTLISPVKEESYRFLEDIYSEMIPAVKSEYFNINCDETFDLGKKESKRAVDSLGYAEVYYNHIMKLYDILKKQNTKMMMWGDVILEHRELLKKLPKDIIICPWNYDARESFADMILPVKEAGFKFYITTGVLNSSKLIPDLSQTFGNIKNFTADAVKYNADGVITSVWDDGGTAFFSNDWYGVAYGAEQCWNNEAGGVEEFDGRFNKCVYGAENNNYSGALRELNKLSELEPTDAMTDKILFDKILPDSTERLSLSLTDLEQVIKLSSETIKLLDKTRLSRYGDDAEYTRFIAQLYKVLAEEKIKLIEAADYYSKAVAEQKTDKSGARRLAVKALAIINGLIIAETEINNWYENLWLMENHIYSLPRITEKFRNKINLFNSVKNGLFASLKQFDSGAGLLPEKNIRLWLVKLPGKYFREWLVIDPAAVNEAALPDTADYLAPMGGVLNAAPEVTQEFMLDTLKLRWRRLTAELPDKVQFRKLTAASNSAAYAYATITSQTARTVTALFGSESDIEIFLNGKSVSRKSADDKFAADKYACSLNLETGKNRLMIKLSGKQTDAGFTFRIQDVQVRNRKNRYRIIN